jgi:hypothetical protein
MKAKTTKARRSRTTQEDRDSARALRQLVPLYEVLWERSHTERDGDTLQRRADAALEAIVGAFGYTLDEVTEALVGGGRRKRA